MNPRENQPLSLEEEFNKKMAYKSRLFKLIRENDDIFLRSFLNEVSTNPDLTLLNKDKLTPLAYAIALSHDEIVKILVNAKADIHALDKNGNDALLFALKQNSMNESIVKTLVDEKANLDAKDLEGNTPLILAAEAKQVSCLKTLLEKKANPQQCNHAKKSALDLALQNHDFKSVEVLNQFNAIIDIFSRSRYDNLLYDAIKSCDVFLTKLLLDVKANPDAQYEFHDKQVKCNAYYEYVDITQISPLHLAVELEDKKAAVIITALVDAKANVNAVNSKDKTPMDLAVSNLYGDHKYYKIKNAMALLRGNPDVTRNNSWPLRVVAGENNYPLMKALIEAKADVKQSRAMFDSASNCSKTGLKILLAAGADVNQGWDDKDKVTPIFHALESPICVSYLLEMKSDIHVVNKAGQTPLVKAILHSNGPDSDKDNYLNSIKILVEAKADLTVKHQGKTIFQLAEEKSVKKYLNQFKPLHWYEFFRKVQVPGQAQRIEENKKNSVSK